jgi:hypothetical protein
MAGFRRSGVQSKVSPGGSWEVSTKRPLGLQPKIKELGGTGREKPSLYRLSECRLCFSASARPVDEEKLTRFASERKRISRRGSPEPPAALAV